MLWVKIPPANLKHISMFGWDMVHDLGTHAWYTGPLGRMLVDKADPRVLVDDESDAIQLGATAILVSKDDGETE